MGSGSAPAHQVAPTTETFAAIHIVVRRRSPEFSLLGRRRPVRLDPCQPREQIPSGTSSVPAEHARDQIPDCFKAHSESPSSTCQFPVTKSSLRKSSARSRRGAHSPGYAPLSRLLRLTPSYGLQLAGTVLVFGLVHRGPSFVGNSGP